MKFNLVFYGKKFFTKVIKINDLEETAETNSNNKIHCYNDWLSTINLEYNSTIDYLKNNINSSNFTNGDINKGLVGHRSRLYKL